MMAGNGLGDRDGAISNLQVAVRPASIVRRILLGAFGGWLLMASLGCDLFEQEDTTSSQKRLAKKFAKKPKVVNVTPPAPAPAPRFIELNVGGLARKLDACYLKLVRATSRSPAVLIVTSYPHEKEESYPSFYMRIVLPSDDLATLLGQPMPAAIWFAPQPNELVYHTADDKPASIAIRNTDDEGRVLGTIINANLPNTGNAESMVITGQFDGVLE